MKSFRNTFLYSKEETLPEPRQLRGTVAAAGDACKGVFGGQGGIYLLDEYRRGAVGNMPACQSTDVHVAIYKDVLYRRGVFATTVARAPGQQLDDDDRAELDAILEDVGTLFSV